MPFDNPSLQVLGRDECLRLLGTVPIGRVAFTVDALPAVQPVAFAVHDEHVVIRIRHGSRLVTGMQDAIVAFEADEYDQASHAGWSVTVVGRATAATEPRLVEQLSTLPLRSWAPNGSDQFMLIATEVVHGRRITRTDASGAPALPRRDP